MESRKGLKKGSRLLNIERLINSSDGGDGLQSVDSVCEDRPVGYSFSSACLPVFLALVKPVLSDELMSRGP